MKSLASNWIQPLPCDGRPLRGRSCRAAIPGVVPGAPVHHRGPARPRPAGDLRVREGGWRRLNVAVTRTVRPSRTLRVELRGFEPLTPPLPGRPELRQGILMISITVDPFSVGPVKELDPIWSIWSKPRMVRSSFAPVCQPKLIQDDHARSMTLASKIDPAERFRRSERRWAAPSIRGHRPFDRRDDRI
jgi:hypothetical protein